MMCLFDGMVFIIEWHCTEMLNTPLHSLSTKHVCTDIQLSRKQEKTESIYLNIHLNPVANKCKSTQNLISLFGGVKAELKSQSE